MFVLASRSRASCFASRCCFLFAVFASCCFLLLLASCFVVASLRVASCCFVLLGCLRCFASLACFLLLASCFLLLAFCFLLLAWLCFASLRASNFCLVCGSCWALSVRYLCCLTCAVASLRLLDCFAPMRWLRARGLLRVGMASLRVVVLFCKRVAYGFAPSF